MPEQNQKSGEKKIPSESVMIATASAGFAGLLPGFRCPALNCNSLFYKLHLPGSLAAWLPAGFSPRGFSEGE